MPKSLHKEGAKRIALIRSERDLCSCELSSYKWSPEKISEAPTGLLIWSLSYTLQISLVFILLLLLLLLLLLVCVCVWGCMAHGPEVRGPGY